MTSQTPHTEKDFDRQYKWKIYIPTTKGWPQGMSKAFRIKSQYDVWLSENNIKGISFYNMLYLTRDQDVVYFKLSWPGEQNYNVVQLR